MHSGRMSALVPAYVLHRRAFRDSSLILELYTLSHGRVGAVARGARRPGSRWRALVEPFQPLLSSWQGRGELMTLTALEAAGPPQTVAGPRLASAFYVNELMLRLLRREDPSEALFEAYAQVISGLSRNDAEEACLRLFEKRLLECLGYGLQLERAADTGAPLEPNRHYRYVIDYGPVCADRGERDVFSGRCLLALGREEMQSGIELGEIRRLMRIALEPHIGDRPLHSRGLYRQLRGRKTGPQGESRS